MEIEAIFQNDNPPYCLHLSYSVMSTRIFNDHLRLLQLMQKYYNRLGTNIILVRRTTPRSISRCLMGM